MNETYSSVYRIYNQYQYTGVSRIVYFHENILYKCLESTLQKMTGEMKSTYQRLQTI